MPRSVDAPPRDPHLPSREMAQADVRAETLTAGAARPRLMPVERDKLSAARGLVIGVGTGIVAWLVAAWLIYLMY